MINLKSVLATGAAFLFAMSAMADSKLKSGDVSLLKDKSLTAVVSFDLSRAIITDKPSDKPYEEYVKEKGESYRNEMDTEVWPMGMQSFVRKWNKVNKKGMQVTDKGTGEYRVVLSPTNMWFGNGAMSFAIGFGAGGAKLSGNIYIYKGEEMVMDIEVKEQTGKSATQARVRMWSLMEELVDDTFEDLGW